MKEIEIRCPVGPRRLFMKMLSAGQRPEVTASNLIELACSDCKRLLRDKHGVKCTRVLHRYDLSGELIETSLVIP